MATTEPTLPYGPPPLLERSRARIGFTWRQEDHEALVRTLAALERLAVDLATGQGGRMPPGRSEKP